MKSLVIFVAVALVVSIFFSSAEALTKDQAQKQVEARKQALEHIKDSKNQSNIVFTQSPKYKIIALQISNVCLTMLRNNVTTDCNYESLVKFDETNPNYAGKFVIKDGLLQRDQSIRKNNIFGYIQNRDFVVCVDCPLKVLIGSRIIHITTDSLFYKLEKDRKVKDNTIITYEKRFVEQPCRSATVINDLLWIEDTINYFKSGCKDTQFNEIKIDKRPYSKLTYDGKEYQYQKALKEKIKASKSTNCIKSDKC